MPKPSKKKSKELAAGKAKSLTKRLKEEKEAADLKSAAVAKAKAATQAKALASFASNLSYPKRLHYVVTTESPDKKNRRLYTHVKK